jgi:hypothetical protein
MLTFYCDSIEQNITLDIPRGKHAVKPFLVSSLKSEWLCICVLGVYILPLSTILILDLSNFSDSVVFFVFL